MVCLDVTETSVRPDAEKLLMAARGEPLRLEAVRIPVPIGVGWDIAAVGKAAQHVSEVADEAMYRAKAAGAGRGGGSRKVETLQ